MWPDQLPEEKPLLVDPKPPRDVVEEPDELDEVDGRLKELLELELLGREVLLELELLLGLELLLDLDDVNPTDVELPGRRELERQRSL
jgi:hypothetical protein